MKLSKTKLMAVLYIRFLYLRCINNQCYKEKDKSWNKFEKRIYGLEMR